MNIFAVLKMAHAWWAILVALLLIIVVINSTQGYFSKREYESIDLRLSLFALIGTHIQLLLGVILSLYFIIQMPYYPLPIRHIITALIGVTVITLGWRFHKKKKTKEGVFGTIAIFYFIGFLLLFSMAPWGYWKSF